MKIPNLRWLIAFALFLAAVFNYIDRSVLGMLAPTIQKDLHISDSEYATVNNFFLTAYVLAYLFSGRIVDKLGVRISLALFLAWWSISNALTGLARSVASLSAFRFMLGLGEAGAFTAAPKAVSQWFPASERGIAVGIYSMGGAVGATLAPILVTQIAGNFGWRWVFAVSPILASVWLVFWLWLYKLPAKHPNITEKEREYLAANIVPEVTPADADVVKTPWLHVLADPAVWKLMLARMLTDPVWYFFPIWMPKYLSAVRGIDQKGLAIMWTVFLAADAGFLLGGVFAGGLIKRGVKPPASRFWIMLSSACLMPLAIFIPQATSLAWVIGLSMVLVYAHTAWLGNISSLIVDIVPKPILATAFGFIACGSALGGIVMNMGVAWLIGHRSYDDCFYLMALLHPIAILIVMSLRKRPAAA